MKIDLHVHTSRYSQCSVMSPEEMAQTAVDCGLDGVVLTEHDVMWPDDELAALRQQFPALTILAGTEVSTAQGHALVYGITPALAADFSFEMPIADLTHLVHNAGGIVILAHPARYADELPGEVFTAGIDGVELASMNVREYMAGAIALIQTRLEVPALACTDAHKVDSLGYYSTDFLSRIETGEDLAEAIKARDYDLISDRQRITAYNDGVDELIAQVARLQWEGILPRQAIKALTGANMSFQDGVRLGRDLRLRIV